MFYGLFDAIQCERQGNGTGSSASMEEIEPGFEGHTRNSTPSKGLKVP
jgi:hypothetical protein